MSTIDSVCLSVMLLQIASFFLDGIEPFFGRHFSVCPSTKRCSSIFDLGPLMPKIYSPKFAQNRLSRLSWQIDRRCLGLPGGIWGWPIQWNHAKCCGPTLVAMAMKFGLGAEIQSPTCLSCNVLVKLKMHYLRLFIILH